MPPALLPILDRTATASEMLRESPRGLVQSSTQRANALSRPRSMREKVSHLRLSRNGEPVDCQSDFSAPTYTGLVYAVVLTCGCAAGSCTRRVASLQVSPAQPRAPRRADLVSAGDLGVCSCDGKMSDRSRAVKSRRQPSSHRSRPASLCVAQRPAGAERVSVTLGYHVPQPSEDDPCVIIPRVIRPFVLNDFSYLARRLRCDGEK